MLQCSWNLPCSGGWLSPPLLSAILSRGTSVPCCLRRAQTHGSLSKGSLMLQGLSGAPVRDAVCCLADFVFNLAFAPALADVRRALGHAGFLWEPLAAQAIFAICDVDHVVRGEDNAHPVDSTVPSDFTYADDSCFCRVFRSNIGVAVAVLGACVIVADVLMRRGMVVNWDRGKSAALVGIRGALSKSARRDLFPEHGSKIAIPGTACVVHLERSYVHFGSGVCAGGSMGPAVAARVRAHAQAMSPLRRCVCPRQAVSTKAKLTFVESLATSRLCHSVGAWDMLAIASLRACRLHWLVGTDARCPCCIVTPPGTVAQVLRSWLLVGSLAWSHV